MFGLIRIIIGLIIFVFIYLMTKKHKLSEKNISCAISCFVSIIIVTMLAFIPFENLVVDFQSPESAYRYYNCSIRDIKLVVSGQESDLVVGSTRKNIYNYLIVPKTDRGWKIGISVNTKTITEIRNGDLYIDVYQYIDTDDYYIVISNLYGNSLEITDTLSTDFIQLEEFDIISGKKSVSYYASINNPKSDYRISINGKNISIDSW